MYCVTVQHDIGIATMFQDGVMKAPFRGRDRVAVISSVEIHLDDLVRRHGLVSDARRRDEKAAVDADTEIAGGSQIEARRIHAQAGGDHLLADLGLSSHVILGPAGSLLHR